MRRLLFVFSIFAMLLSSVVASAKHVSPAEARRVAETFLKGVGCKHLQGREVASFVGGNEIDMGGLGSGVYSLHILTPSGVAVKRVVVRK